MNMSSTIVLISVLLANTIIYANTEIDYTKYDVQKMSASEIGEYTIGSLEKTDITPKTWLKIHLEVQGSNKTLAKVTLLRPIWWFQQHKPKVNGIIHISVPDIGVRGNGKVLAIESCNADSRKISSSRRIITGRFIHPNAEIWDITLEDSLGNQKTFGATANHSIFSRDRKKWTTIHLLRLGERVIAFNKNKFSLKKRQKRKGLYKVYNIEFHRSHVFYLRKPVKITRKR